MHPGFLLLKIACLWVPLCGSIVQLHCLHAMLLDSVRKIRYFTGKFGLSQGRACPWFGEQTIAWENILTFSGEIYAFWQANRRNLYFK